VCEQGVSRGKNYLELISGGPYSTTPKKNVIELPAFMHCMVYGIGETKKIIIDFRSHESDQIKLIGLIQIKKEKRIFLFLRRNY
jgi:hypothetical protein